ncbi:MAG: putative addiction module antidote protein [Candidatus Tokpelaia sp.]|uniref:addiction module antidote protein n=1 Tax=Candidatus Tokpelaia sp. TaxID=2233777 RepID=UPI00123C565F|nr:addiction module antidote protein [Candidatus Tokpelaia sp.]KAA6205862.1 MAG: putative addiction module antidote protein [Candidatus Tokpelaia sp.]KAA6207712.1 MAG: putative addiction module antidote protein [Candidatus Tokpelaia sp.]KAA6404885.1 putative addiction module antidote protein [Candidatus Tokpelaia sp.]
MQESFTLYDSANYLKTEEDIIGYLEEIMKDAGNNPALVAHALGVAARAHNFAALAKETGKSQKGLIKALSGNGNPSFATIAKVAEALGLDIILRPKQKAGKAAQ